MTDENAPRERQVWLWRAGEGAKDYQLWMERGLAALGFGEVGDLTDARDKAAVRTIVEAGKPEAAPGNITATVGTLLRFAVEAQLEDVVVTPNTGGHRLAIGRVAGPYRYEDVDGTRRHTRRVIWVREDVTTDSLPITLGGKIKTVHRLGGEAEAAAILAFSPRLIPLPAADRDRSYPISLEKILNILEFIVDRRAHKDVLNHIRAEHPGMKERAINSHLFRASMPLAVMRNDLDDVVLTDLGTAFLKSRDPDVFRDHLLTTMFGPDHFLVKLAREPLASGDIRRFFRSVHPTLRGDGTASGWLRCLKDLEVIAENSDKKLALTERGQLWRKAIHWKPERLPIPVNGKRNDLIVPSLADVVQRVQKAAGEQGLAFPQKLIASLHLGLWAHDQRHFAIFAGLSGSGKTQLARLYASAVTGAEAESDIRLCVVSAAPGWHDPGPLLGYVNPLDGWYVETDFQRFLVNASENPREVHACVLDEMNLSHPEQYLAPLLSAMERAGGMVDFHTDDQEDLDVPARIAYPRNLVLIGTVNMDETTMGIADKTLDRAFTLEFWDIEVDKWPGWKTCQLEDNERDTAEKVLNELMSALSPARLHFGWRVIAEVVRFLERRTADKADLSPTEALDDILYAKVLPKLRGDDSPRFRTALEKCGKVLADAKLDRSARKVGELLEDLKGTGSFRFWR